MNGTDLAVVTGGRTELRRAPTATGEVTRLAGGLSDLLRPQFTRYGELWAIGRKGGRQKLWLSTADQDIGDPKVDEVAAPVLDEGKITAFRISPDGARMALVRQTANGHELGLARIIRGDKVTVDGWRPVDVTQTGGTQVTQIADVAWLDATELLLLGAATKDAAHGPGPGDGRRLAGHRRGGRAGRLGRRAADRAVPAADRGRGRRRRPDLAGRRQPVVAVPRRDHAVAYPG